MSSVLTPDPREQVWNGIEINAIDFGRTEEWRCKKDCSGTDQSKVSIVLWFKRVSDVENVDSNFQVLNHKAQLMRTMTRWLK